MRLFAFYFGFLQERNACWVGVRVQVQETSQVDMETMRQRGIVGYWLDGRQVGRWVIGKRDDNE